MKPDSTQPRIDSHGATRTGRERSTNSDQFLVAELQRAAQVSHSSKYSLDDSRQFGDRQAHLMLVADGVTSHAGARRASSLAVDEVLESVLNALPWAPRLDADAEVGLRRSLRETVERCNEEVVAAGRQMPGTGEMSTTLTLAFVRWPLVFVVHAGDSRAYLLRGEEMNQLTTDHTLAQQLLDAGAAEDHEASQFGKMLWNAVGGDGHITPEITVEKLLPGDILLLCTNGLTRLLSDRSIRSIVTARATAEGACRDLIGTAASAGAIDDVTVAITRFGGVATGDEEPAPRQAEAARAARPLPPPAPQGRGATTVQDA